MVSNHYVPLCALLSGAHRAREMSLAYARWQRWAMAYWALVAFYPFYTVRR